MILSLLYSTYSEMQNFSVNDNLNLVVVFHKTLLSNGAGQSTWLGLSSCLSWLNFAFQAREIGKKLIGTHST